jgi:hypothetical protein
VYELQMPNPSSLRTQNEAPTTPLTKRDEVRRTRHLWLRMVQMFGHRWISSYGVDGSNSTGALWAKGLCGLTDSQIGNGLTALLASADEWPPSLPAFRKLCLGIPTLGTVQFELRTPTTRARASAFSSLVWSLLDHYRFSNASIVIADRLLRDAYLLAVEQVMTGRAALP